MKVCNMDSKPFDKSSLPLPHPTTSYWQHEAIDSDIHDHGRYTPLPNCEDSFVDVAIIGSGISGSVAAYMLQNKGDIRKVENDQKSKPSIIMLEARKACSGATGRNGGHCRPDMFAGFNKYSSLVGNEQAGKVLKNELETFTLIDEIISTESLDCDWWKGTTMTVYQSKQSLEIASSNFDVYREYMVKQGKKFNSEVQLIKDKFEARKVSRVKDAVGVAIWPAGSLHPLRFVHHLLKICLSDKNFSLFTHTPALSIQKSKVKDNQSRIYDGWEISTPRGTIKARSVLLATNGYSLKLLSDLNNVLMPHRSQCSAFSPPSNFINAMAFNNTYSIVKGPGDYEYLTQQPSKGGPNSAKELGGRKGTGSMILGGGHPHAPKLEQVGTFDDTTITEKVSEHLQSYSAKTFTDWEEGKSTLYYTWTGIQGCKCLTTKI
jgi:glycine/D-amino acid oxidase-like deaminating enzyme